MAMVTGVEPQVPDRLEGRGVVVPVAGHHHVRAHGANADLTGLAIGDREVVLVKDAYVVPRDRDPHRAGPAPIEPVEGDRSGFGQAVHVEDRHAEAVLELEYLVTRGGGADHDPDGVVRVISALRLLHQDPEHLAHAVERGHTLPAALIPEPAGREAAVDDRLRAGDHRGHQGHVLGVGVEQGEDRQQHVVLGVAGHLGCAHRQVDVVVVGQHDTLWWPRGAAGEQDRGGLARFHLDRLHRCRVGEQSGEVVKRPPAVGVGRRLPDDHDVLDARRVPEPRQHVLEEDILDDQNTSLRRVQDVRDTRSPGRVVDRHLDGRELEDPEPRVEELRPVPHHDRDPLALGDAQVLEAGGDVSGALGGLGIGHGVIIEDGKHALAELGRLFIDQGR